MKKKTLLDACQQYDFKKVTEYLNNFNTLNGKSLVSETRHGMNIFKPSFFYDNWATNYTQLVELLLNNKLILKMVKSREAPFEDLFFEILQTNQEDILKTFLKYDIDVNQKTKQGDNALLFCIQHQHYKMVPFLLENGVDVNYCNKNQYNALLLSILKKQEGIANLLLDRKIDVNQEICFINGRKKEYTNAIKLALDGYMFNVALKLIKNNDIQLSLLEDTYFYLDNFHSSHTVNIRLALEEKINVIYEKDTLTQNITSEGTEEIPRKKIKI